MIKRITNTDEKFYEYMGKYFGSRIVEKQTNDRIYDDNEKEWYIYLQEEKVVAFVSIYKNIIKNIYTEKEEYLEEILKELKKQKNIGYSIVTNLYKDMYLKSGFKIYENKTYKNFVTIYMEK